jgi:putative ABC transport system permease protein
MLSIYFVAPDYLSITGIPLKSGRFFGEAEASAGLAVGVIDERAAARFWPDQSAIGQRFRYSPYAPWITVIGIAGHVKTRDFAWPSGTIQAYVPAQLFRLVPVSRQLLVRTDGNADQALATIRSVVKAIDPALQPDDMLPVSRAYDTVLTEPRFFFWFMTAFAGLALLTASVGLYGLVNYAVGQRTREIGVRIALGAGLGRVRRLVLREALIPVVLGLVTGLAASVWLSRYLSSLLYEIAPHDPATFVAVMALLVTVAAVAAYIPARKATRIDPVATLRAD